MLSSDARPVDQGFSRSAVDGDGSGFAVLGVDGIEGDLVLTEIHSTPFQPQ
jgi:hypothetical protein